MCRDIAYLGVFLYYNFVAIVKQKHFSLRKTRFIALVASTVDGRISLTKKSLPDWTSKEDSLFFQKSLKSFDAVVVGRNTYLSAESSLCKRNTFVLTSCPKTIERKGTVVFVNPASVNLAEIFREYKNIAVLGGGAVYCFMLENGFLDEIFVTIEPLIFGRGKEMFIGGTKTVQVKLLSMKRLNLSGTILLHYKIL